MSERETVVHALIESAATVIARSRSSLRTGGRDGALKANVGSIERTKRVESSDA